MHCKLLIECFCSGCCFRAVITGGALWLISNESKICYNVGLQINRCLHTWHNSSDWSVVLLWLKSRMIDCFLVWRCLYLFVRRTKQSSWNNNRTCTCVRVSVCVFLQLDEGTPPEPEGSFVDYQTSMVKYSKAIAVTAQEMVSHQNKQFTLLGCKWSCWEEQLFMSLSYKSKFEQPVVYVWLQLSDVSWL